MVSLRKAACAVVDEILGGFQYTGIHGVLIDVLDGFADTLRRFQIAAILDAMQAPNDFWRPDGLHRFVTHPREYVNLQVTSGLAFVASRPDAIFAGTFEPGTRHQLEGIHLGDLGLLLLFSPSVLWVDALSA